MTYLKYPVAYNNLKAKADVLLDKASICFVKSLKMKRDSEDFKMARLLHDKYTRLAHEYTEKMLECFGEEEDGRHQ